jgi:hypothetical protein
MVAACDSGGGDADGDVDAGQACVDTNEACDMSAPDRCPVDGDCRYCHDEDEVCLHHTCVCALNRTYEVEVLSAAIYSRTPTGNCWDGEAPHCQDPDPYAVLCFGGEHLECTGGTRYKTVAPQQDTVNPIWNETFTTHVGEHTLYGAWIFDDDSADGDEDDLILELEPLFWLDAAKLRKAGIRIEAGDAATKTVLDLIMSPQ